MDSWSRKIAMFRTLKIGIFGAILGLSSVSKVLGSDPWKISETVFDFGAVGVEYNIFHDFKFTNIGGKVIRIDSVDVKCDCSSVRYEKAVLGPGESVDLKLTFDTKDFFGPVNRQFNLFLSTPERRVIRFFYLAEVGQWQNGLKPEPFAVFLLPTLKKQTVKITNRYFESMRAEIMDIQSNLFTVELTNEEVGTNGQLELTVVADPNLGKGTYQSNFTVKIITDDEDNPAYLTIPVKIARF